MKYFVFALLFSFSFDSFAQIDSSCFVEKDFLIIQSTKDYSAALFTVKEASKKLGIKINLKYLVPDKDSLIGLSLSKAEKDSIKASPFDYDTVYVPRGRWDDGIYISIEYSNRYDNFSKGYYLVMVGSGFKKDPQVAKTLKKVKTKYPDAYIKRSKVYICCMH